jgi:DNA-binding NarL/FixJ family response regulator
VASWSGDLDTATALVAEIEAVREATGIRLYSSAGLMLAAYRGHSTEASTLIATTTAESIGRGEGIGSQHAAWAASTLNNGLGRYAAALTAAEEIGRVPESHGAFFSAAWALPERIEAAVRTGDQELAARALRQFESTVCEESDWGLGLVARCRALVSDDGAAEQHYVEAIDRLARTQLRPDLARAHLLYGEWLRRDRRRADARKHLRTAYDILLGVGAEAFAERARWELLATGETVRKREVDTYQQLTPQEEHIARLARDGRTNSEIGAELFISAKTVEWHLSKVFAKLGITSRRGLHAAMPPLGRPVIGLAKK